MRFLKFHLCILITIGVVLAFQTKAQTIFTGDTLSIKLQPFNLDKMDSMGYSFNPRVLKQYLKVAYNDDLQYADVKYKDEEWAIDSLREIPKEHIQKTIWYRFKLKIDSTSINHPFSLKMFTSGAVEVYIDGALHSKIGTISKNPKLDDYKILSEYPILLSFSDTNVHQLAIRYKSNLSISESNYGFFQFNIEDTYTSISQVRFGGIYTGITLMGFGGLFLALFIVHLMLYLFYKKDKANLHFAIFTFSIALSLILGYLSFHASSVKINEINNSLIGSGIIVACYSLCAFITYVFTKKAKWLKVIYILCLITILLSLLSEAFYIISVYAIWVPLVCALLYTITMTIRAIIKKIPGALILGSGILYFLLFIVLMFLIGLLSNGIKFGTVLSYFTLISFLSIPISISAFLAWRFATTNKALSKELKNVEALSSEKQQILESQNEMLEQQVSERTQELQTEKQKSDDLLLNILPQEVAEELKATGASKAQHYDEVSVLFTDFVNFTMVSEQLGAEELLNELNENFTAFDRIMEQHGLEKIKTIGDAYLAVSGLPVKSEQHAQNAVAAALEIIEYVNQRKQTSKYGLDIRIGINSGALVAGIVGVKKFAFDIWGDTVNTAARMEQSSEPGKLNISASTYSLVKNDFACTFRGKINAKGKGEMEMYFVNATI